ncbi:MAG: 50S ribosomal protein L29 [Candidatus Bathyarchaeota archaeon]|nr:MAG: 50S ribosomal protein L29 [Candidatus Bathyarchaeota archaeon]
MPILRIQEIRDMSSEERARRLDELRTELSKIRTMVHAGGSVENPGRVKAIKKAIARILTIDREELEE